MIMRKIFNIIEEPIGKIYSKLLNQSLQYCDAFLFVVRPSMPQSESLKKIIEDLQSHIVNKEDKSEWPGTKLINNTATIYKFKLNHETVDFLTSKTHNLYSWLQPDLPEDLCLLRADKNPWLVTISHEKDGYLLLSMQEKENLVKAIPGLALAGNTGS